MGRLFGTDGVRGLANRDLTPELALSVALAVVHVLREASSTQRPVAVIGRDPRSSGEMLEAAVIAGLTSAGADVLRVGVLPTPAVAYLTAHAGADLGVMLSASHNPMPDNGIKLFGRGGLKLADSVEEAIETAVADHLVESWERPVGGDVGRVREFEGARELYADHLLSTLPHRLDGLVLVIDCAHGAASAVAREVHERAGAKVVAVGAEPDGVNINDGVGSTYLAPLSAAVVEQGADAGIAYDGDADRCLAVSADGAVVDGDQIMAILALAKHEAGTLREDTVVATVMSNLGLHIALREHGIALDITPVGDRYVLEELTARRLSMGGEQSGHIVLPDLATTGDGIMTGLQLLGHMARTGRSLADLAAVVQRLPQVLLNVAVGDKEAVAAADAVATAVAAASVELGDSGRVLLRPSGTEQLVRVMVEAPTQSHAQEVAERLAEVVRVAGG
ncbi:MAG: phosphoglucosamine mutase [Actinomycetota bacterium]|nr:phosphoglucosamine mutase [Actinomycetota bacterium]